MLRFQFRRQIGIPSCLLFLPGLALIAGLSGCGVPSLRQSLSNSGPLPLDPKNPYVATNQLLTEESEGSPTVRGFLKYKGAPDAIEVRKNILEPYKIYLYYVRENVAYRLDESKVDWIIKGPETIPGGMQSTLRHMKTPRGERREPVLNFEEDQEDLDKAREIVGMTPPKTRLEDLIRAEKQAKPRTAGKTKPAAKQSRREEDLTAELKVVQEPIDEGLADESPIANETPSGDIVHRVTFRGETLRMISNWYTGDVTNAARIARINNLRNPNQLEMGQVVRIPRYMLMRTEPLPADEVQQRMRSAGS